MPGFFKRGKGKAPESTVVTGGEEINQQQASSSSSGSSGSQHSESEQPASAQISPSSSFSASSAIEHGFVTRRATEVMARHLHDLSLARHWIEEGNEQAWVGIRWDRESYAIEPPRLQSSINPVLSGLNCGAAMAMATPLVQTIIANVQPHITHIQITATEKIQVLDSFDNILFGLVRRAQSAAFVRDSRMLLLWCDDVDALEVLADEFSDKLIRFVWSSATSANHVPIFQPSPLDTPYATSSIAHHNQNPFSAHNSEIFGRLPAEADSIASPNLSAPDSPSQGSSSGNEESKQEEGQAQGNQPEARPVLLMAPVLRGLSVGLDIVICGNFARQVVSEYVVDGDAMRLVLLVVLVPIFFVLLFFCESLIASVAMIVAPIRAMSLNTRYYSGKAPLPLPATVDLPHITVQMPVFKESLRGVIKPSLDSIRRAISTYERQGGTASIVMAEDGINVLDDDEREERIRYYVEHDIAWIARPKQSEAYKRAGKFKKASNLNFSCAVSSRVDALLAEQRSQDEKLVIDEAVVDRALAQALAEAHPEARGAGDVRFGDLILIVDADTRVPSSCFLDAATEMLQSPEVAVLQHGSGIMIVSESYFERCMAYFTRMVNFTIGWTCSTGEVAPFMGHNAYLRWSALQDAAIVNPQDGTTKIWSEETVSEDFDLALRLIEHGYTTRWCTYANYEYLEGVSLTVDDEMNRWRKYMFGVLEIMFNPLVRWPTHSPFSKLFRSFLWSSAAPTHYKFNALAYICSYAPIAVALPWAVGLYLLQGWFYPVLDPVFFQPYQTWLAVMVVYAAGGFAGIVVARHRAKDMTIFKAAGEHLRNAPLFILFFGGLSYHILTASLCFFFSVDISFGATAKDVSDSNFFLEVPAIMKKHWRPILLNTLVLAGVGVLATDLVPLEWRIQSFAGLWTVSFISGCHILAHIILNPALLRFSF